VSKQGGYDLGELRPEGGVIYGHRTTICLDCCRHRLERTTGLQVYVTLVTWRCFTQLTFFFPLVFWV